jgi:3-oxoacyl-[acyl-carrier protein] reductase
MNLGLGGKTALITGGTHGIGLSISLALANEGCNVIVCSRTSGRIQTALAALNKINSGGAYYGYEFDALDRDSISRMISDIKRDNPGGVDILVNNVGGGGRWGKPEVLDNDLNVWDEVYQKNVGVSIQLTTAFLAGMLEKGWGRVIGITSIYGRCAGGRPWFNVAKFAETALFKNFSQIRAFIRSGVTFNTVAPGAIMIPNTGWDLELGGDATEARERLDMQFPLGRLGTPDEVASVVTFLASKQASYVNGASILVDGGETSVI